VRWTWLAPGLDTPERRAFLHGTDRALAVVIMKFRYRSVSSGNQAGGTGLAERLKLVANQVTPIVLEDTGHRVIDEHPAEVLQALETFL
jgi:pimeloyl-ACP methyl ester carboxylesterase